MKRFQMPKKEKFSHVPLLQIQIEKEFEEELIKAALLYKEKPFSQQREGKIFRDALQKHIWDPNFPHILESPKIRLLTAIKEQWLTAKDFYLVIFWLWKSTKGELFDQMSEWLAKNQPAAKEIYSADFDKTENIDEILSKWAGIFTQTPDQIGSAKLTMAIILYADLHPDVFTKFTSEDKPAPSKTSKSEIVNMAHKKDNLWTSILGQLNKAPHDLFQATEFEQFVEQARVIVEQKIDAQKKDQRQSVLSAELQNILAVLAPWDKYFKFPARENWSVETLATDAVDTISDKFVVLNDNLNKLDGLNKSQPSNRDERLARDREVSEAEDKALAIYNELNALFGNFSKEDLASLVDKTSNIADTTPAQVEVEIVADKPTDLLEEVSTPKESDVVSPDATIYDMPDAEVELIDF